MNAQNETAKTAKLLLRKGMIQDNHIGVTFVGSSESDRKAAPLDQCKKIDHENNLWGSIVQEYKTDLEQSLNTLKESYYNVVETFESTLIELGYNEQSETEVIVFGKSTDKATKVSTETQTSYLMNSLYNPKSEYHLVKPFREGDRVSLTQGTIRTTEFIHGDMASRVKIAPLSSFLANLDTVFYGMSWLEGILQNINIMDKGGRSSNSQKAQLIAKATEAENRATEAENQLAFINLRNEKMIALIALGKIENAMHINTLNTLKEVEEYFILHNKPQKVAKTK